MRILHYDVFLYLGFLVIGEVQQSVKAARKKHRPLEYELTEHVHAQVHVFL